MSNFQIIFIGILVVIAVVGITTFALVKTQNTDQMSLITIWGMLPKQTFDAFISDYNQAKATELKVNYEQKNAVTFDAELAEAIADGRGPDVILVAQDKLTKHASKILPIPFTALSERMFKDTFVQEGELYLTRTGILGLPFVSDPLVMYWNRDIFTSAAITAPPKKWNEIVSLVPKLTQKNDASAILRSTVALGEYRNVSHAKAILSALFMQTGDPIVAGNTDTSEAVFGQRRGQAPSGTSDALRFYMQFSDPSNEAYSWNRSLPNSLDAFAFSNLAMYFGFGSELPVIQQKNSNLNFDVAPLPEQGGVTNLTFANLYAFSVMRQSPHVAEAIGLISTLTSLEAVYGFTSIANYAPARLDLLANPPPNAISPILYISALRGRAWLDPSAEATDSIFLNMVESISSGREKLQDAIDRAGSEIVQLTQ